MTEKRDSKRYEVREWARVAFEDGRAPMNCILLDISETGAGLIIKDGEVPETFYLYRRKDRTLRHVTVVRRGRRSIGVRLDELIDPASEKARGILTSIHAIA